jgi:aldehyde:ferredoxin oxidoreductase
MSRKNSNDTIGNRTRDVPAKIASVMLNRQKEVEWINVAVLCLFVKNYSTVQCLCSLATGVSKPARTSEHTVNVTHCQCNTPSM